MGAWTELPQLRLRGTPQLPQQSAWSLPPPQVEGPCHPPLERPVLLLESGLYRACAGSRASCGSSCVQELCSRRSQSLSVSRAAPFVQSPLRPRRWGPWCEGFRHQAPLHRLVLVLGPKGGAKVSQELPTPALALMLSQGCRVYNQAQVS